MTIEALSLFLIFFCFVSVPLSPAPLALRSPVLEPRAGQRGLSLHSGKKKLIFALPRRRLDFPSSHIKEDKGNRGFLSSKVGASGPRQCDSVATANPSQKRKGKKVLVLPGQKRPRLDRSVGALSPSFRVSLEVSHRSTGASTTSWSGEDSPDRWPRQFLPGRAARRPSPPPTSPLRSSGSSKRP